MLLRLLYCYITTGTIVVILSNSNSILVVTNITTLQLKTDRMVEGWLAVDILLRGCREDSPNSTCIYYIYIYTHTHIHIYLFKPYVCVYIYIHTYL